jgi:hypothetical protein
MTDPFGPPLFNNEPAYIYIAGSPLPRFLNPYTGEYSIRSASYARRVQSGYQRGVSLSEARGYRTISGITESQRRRQRTIAELGITPQEQFEIGFEQRYGFTYRYWRYLRRHWIDDINSRSAPSGHITPRHIQMELNYTAETGHDESWIETRLYEKLTDMIAFQDYKDKTPGRMDWDRKDGYAINFFEDYEPDYQPMMWWWYH